MQIITLNPSLDVKGEASLPKAYAFSLSSPVHKEHAMGGMRIIPPIFKSSTCYPLTSLAFPFVSCLTPNSVFKI